MFRALGDKQRQEVLFKLGKNPGLSVGELAGMMALSRPAVSHHIKILKSAGLLSEQKRGVRRYYSPSFGPSVQVMKQLTEFVTSIEDEII